MQTICQGLSSENKSEVELLPTEHCGRITEQEAKGIKDSRSCESNDESADDTNTTNRKSKLHDLPMGLE